MKTDYKIFFILLIASSIGTVLVIPYTLTLQGTALNQLGVPSYLVFVSALVNSLILFSILIFLGLNLAKRVGLGVPILEDWLEKKPVKDKIKSMLPISIGLGIVAGLLILGFNTIFNQLDPSAAIQISQSTPPAWQGFLSSFYGGINEEIMMRLFVMSLLVWIFFKIKSTTQNDKKEPTKLGIWAAIIIAAILFGLGHLPVTSAITTITPIIILRAIVLNGIGGIVFGWLYWKKGLESAMVSHFSADIILHVIPMLFI